jgi:hypothetical protein
MNSQAHAEKNLRRLALGLKAQWPPPFPTHSTNVVPLLAKKHGGDLDLRAVRAELIQAAAYYRAEKRGFIPGAELDDWLASEAEIDARLIRVTRI